MTIQEEERQRVARDLHDSVGQTVLAAKLNIEAYLKNKGDGERLGNGLAFLDRASQELRSIYNGLYPSILDDLGFEAAVRWYARHILEANGITVSLDIALESQIKPNTAVNLYRVVQETLSNVLKHSGSDSVRLQVHEKDGIITLTVQDEGIGFDENEPGVDRFGLVSLRYRARLLGGECRIDSKAGEGTTVTVTAMRGAP
jgi:two-component system NarL family sensor kinase